MNRPTMELRGASLRAFGQLLLEATDWQVTPGRVTVLIGPSGTGKSALLRALAGQRRDDTEVSGTWLFDGEQYSHTTHERICLVPQLGIGSQRNLAEVLRQVSHGGKELEFLRRFTG